MGGGESPELGVRHRSQWLLLLEQEQLVHAAWRPARALCPGEEGACAGTLPQCLNINLSVGSLSVFPRDELRVEKC